MVQSYHLLSNRSSLTAGILTLFFGLNLFFFSNPYPVHAITPQLELIGVIQNEEIERVKGILSNTQKFKKINFWEPNSSTEKQDTLLGLAARKGNPDIFIELLNVSPDSDRQTRADGATPLWVASEAGKNNIVTMLLKSGADSNLSTVDGTTPLYIASLEGHRDVVNTLLHHGAIPDKAKRDGATPLFAAAEKGQLNILGMLLERGAAIDWVDINGNTVLFKAIENHHLEVVQFLLRRGMNPNHVRKGDDITPLFLAAQVGDLAIVRELLNNDDVNTSPTSKDGTTPLFIAAAAENYHIVNEFTESGRIDFKYEIQTALKKKRLDIARDLIAIYSEHHFDSNDPNVPAQYRKKPLLSTLVRLGFIDEDHFECPICYCPMGMTLQEQGKRTRINGQIELDAASITSCGHCFCAKCLDGSISNRPATQIDLDLSVIQGPPSCPLCRQILGPENILKIE